MESTVVTVHPVPVEIKIDEIIGVENINFTAKHLWLNSVLLNE